jgi:hypothetical protein
MVMKRMILAITIALLGISTGVFAQEKVEEVTLTVSGDGLNKEEATKVALRSAVEQAFGVFVSANTSILDDELVKDEIATVSSGNIKKYEEIASVQLPNGNTAVTLKAIVSISKLVGYAQSKGSSAEFAGATFGMNMRLKELNKVNEEKAIANMVSQLEALAPAMFDYELKMGEPVVVNKLSEDDAFFMDELVTSRSGGYDLPAKVLVIPNGNTKLSLDILFNTLGSVALSNDEESDYKKVNLRTYKLEIGSECNGSAVYMPQNLDLSELLNKGGNISREKYHTQAHNVMEAASGRPTNDYYLSVVFRSEMSTRLITNFFEKKIYDAIYGFKITDNLNNISMIESGGRLTEKWERKGVYLSQSYYGDQGKVTGLLENDWGLSPISIRCSSRNKICIPHLSLGISTAQKSGELSPDQKLEAVYKAEMEEIEQYAGRSLTFTEKRKLKKQLKDASEETEEKFIEKYLKQMGLNMSSSEYAKYDKSDYEKLRTLYHLQTQQTNEKIFKATSKECYIVDLTLNIPKDDIMKYNNFTITHK